jgi:hypothetical protein
MDPAAARLILPPVSEDDGDLQRERLALVQRLADVTDLRIIRVLHAVLCLCLGIID